MMSSPSNTHAKHVYICSLARALLFVHTRYGSGIGLVKQKNGYP